MLWCVHKINNGFKKLTMFGQAHTISSKILYSTTFKILKSPNNSLKLTNSQQLNFKSGGYLYPKSLFRCARHSPTTLQFLSGLARSKLLNIFNGPWWNVVGDHWFGGTFIYNTCTVPEGWAPGRGWWAPSTWRRWTERRLRLALLPLQTSPVHTTTLTLSLHNTRS